MLEELRNNKYTRVSILDFVEDLDRLGLIHISNLSILVLYIAATFIMNICFSFIYVDSYAKH